MTQINSRELANLLGLSYQTVQTYMKRGQWWLLPPPIKIGHRYRWNVEEVVMPWLAKHQVRFDGETNAETRRNLRRASVQH